MARGQCEAAMSLEKRLQKNKTLKSATQKPLTRSSTPVTLGNLNKPNCTKPKTKCNGICPIILSLTPINLEKVRSVRNAAVNYQCVALIDKILSAPDLLQSLIGIIFCFREHQVAVSADVEAMFRQIVVPGDDSRCLRFIWREEPELKMEVFEYKQHLFGAKILPTCSNIAFCQVAKDNAVNDESFVRIVQRHFYMNNFRQSELFKSSEFQSQSEFLEKQ